MSIKKKIFSIICTSMLTMSIILTPMQNSFAAEVGNEVIVSEEYAKEQMENNKLRYGESEKITVLNTEYKTTTVTPTGQPAGGNSFPNGGGLYINSSKGAVQNISFGLGWGKVSVGVSLGQSSSSSSIGGKYVSFPANKNFYKVKIDKKFKFERHKVDVYQYGQYKYTYYTTVNKLYSESTYLVRV